MYVRGNSIGTDDGRQTTDDRSLYAVDVHMDVSTPRYGHSCLLEEFVSHTRPYSNASVGRATG